jgi:hypothetical protein
MLTHVVGQGECLISIAARYGFADWRTIYNHPGKDERHGEGSFAFMLRDALLDAFQGEFTGRVDAHTCSAHSTRNQFVRRFEPPEGSPGKWIVMPGTYWFAKMPRVKQEPKKAESQPIPAESPEMKRKRRKERSAKFQKWVNALWGQSTLLWRFPFLKIEEIHKELGV